MLICQTSCTRAGLEKCRKRKRAARTATTTTRRTRTRGICQTRLQNSWLGKMRKRKESSSSSWGLKRARLLPRRWGGWQVGTGNPKNCVKKSKKNCWEIQPKKTKKAAAVELKRARLLLRRWSGLTSWHWTSWSTLYSQQTHPSPYFPGCQISNLFITFHHFSFYGTPSFGYSSNFRFKIGH